MKWEKNIIVPKMLREKFIKYEKISFFEKKLKQENFLSWEKLTKLPKTLTLILTNLKLNVNWS